MTVHIPVLAGELVDLLDPAPGEVAVDCTFGGGGHARLIAERIGPAGTLIGIDRDPEAQARFEEMAAEVAATPASSARRSPRASSSCATRACARTWSTSTSACPRCRSTRASAGSPTPTTRRWTCAWTPTRSSARTRSSTRGRRGSWRAPSVTSARSATRRRSRARSSATARSRPRNDLVEAIVAAVPAPARFAGGHPAKRVFQALRIVVNDELSQIDEALPLAWDVLKQNGRFAGISFHSLEDRRVKRFLAARAQGCVCPPDLPICVCGHEPEAELVSRRAISPSAGEVAHNPRSASARMRVARKL